MATAELSRAETSTLTTRLAQMTNRLSRIRDKAEKDAGRVQQTAFSAGATFVLGMLEARAEAEHRAMATFMGLDHKLVYGGIALAVGMFASGKVSEVGHDVAQGILDVYAYNLGREQGARAAADTAHPSGGAAP